MFAFGALRLLGVLGVGAQLLDELLAGPDAAEPDLDVIVRAQPRALIGSRAPSTIRTGSPMSRMKDLTPLPIAPACSTS
jgi:hypothetical protein